MYEDERGSLPDWTERERLRDLIWIKGNSSTFWSIAQQGYKEFGPGVVAIETTSYSADKGMKCAYLSQEMTEEFDNMGLQQMIE